MLKKKQAGIPAPRQRAEGRPQNVVNLMDALREARPVRTEARSKARPELSRVGQLVNPNATAARLTLNGQRRYGYCNRNAQLCGSLASPRLILSPAAVLSARHPRSGLSR